MTHLKMVGSSIFEQWGIPNWRDLNVYNDAIGGTTAAYWAQNIRKYLSPEIWNYAVYCGSNDLNEDLSADRIIDDITAVLDIIRKGGHNHQVVYFSIMKAPQKEGKFAVIDRINEAVNQHLSKRDLYIDLNSIINQDPKWYIDDKLHLTRECYLEMEAKIENKLWQWAV